MLRVGFFCGMLRCVSASTFVIVSPTDYQNILAELRSPAALRSAPPFLDPELPVTPSPSVTTDGPLPSGPPPLPWSPRPSPSRSPPRPRELLLSLRLPDPAPSKVRKPHIALNDQLLSGEEEDRFYQELELSCGSRSRRPLLAACELDADMAASTSSPSLTSLSSITPSSPERPRGPPCVLVGRQEVGGSVESKGAGMVATEMEGNVEKWLKPDLIKHVDRKCEMIMKGRCEGGAEESVERELLVEVKEAGRDVEPRDAQDRSERGGDFRNSRVEPQAEGTAEGDGFKGDGPEEVNQGGQTDKEGRAGPRSHVWLTSGDEAQAWVDHRHETGSRREEEGDEELPGGFLLEVVEKGGGTEEKKELRGPSRVRLEQTEKQMLSPVGWHSDSSSVNVEPPTPGRSVSSDLLDRRER